MDLDYAPYLMNLYFIFSKIMSNLDVFDTTAYLGLSLFTANLFNNYITLIPAVFLSVTQPNFSKLILLTSTLFSMDRLSFYTTFACVVTYIVHEYIKNDKIKNESDDELRKYLDDDPIFNDISDKLTTVFESTEEEESFDSKYKDILSIMGDYLSRFTEAEGQSLLLEKATESEGQSLTTEASKTSLLLEEECPELVTESQSLDTPTYYSIQGESVTEETQSPYVEGITPLIVYREAHEAPKKYYKKGEVFKVGASVNVI